MICIPFFSYFQEIIEELETIDDEVDAYGIALVTTEVTLDPLGPQTTLHALTQDIKYAGATLNIRKFPALGMFR